jgi:Fe-S-cluster containining protein
MSADTDLQPWYHEGLHFHCTRCGNCCTGAPGFVWVDEDETAAIAQRLGESVAQFQAVYTRVAHRGRTLRERTNGDCVFYDAVQGCTIYDVRPRQCRTWPFWESNVRTPRDWQQTCRICPGAGLGDLIPAEEISRRLREIRL